MTFTISPIPAFKDNYIWAIAHFDQVWIVDPGDASPVKSFLSRHNFKLAGILITHHHYDHTSGISKLLSDHPRTPVYGTTGRVPEISKSVEEGDRVSLGDIELSVISVPGHTSDHIAYFGNIPDNGPCLFCGDTLFSAGCGRLFEGSPSDMQSSIDKLSKLPDETKIFCAHEYTMANLQFAKAVMPENEAVQQRITECKALVQNKRPTLPALLAEEKQYNPFLMTATPEVVRAVCDQSSAHMDKQSLDKAHVFGALRYWKDQF